MNEIQPTSKDQARNLARRRNVAGHQTLIVPWRYILPLAGCKAQSSGMPSLHAQHFAEVPCHP